MKNKNEMIMTEHIAQGMANCSNWLTKGMRTCDRLLKRCIANVLLFFAYLGIDIQLEAESLENDFVNSKTFIKQAILVFKECDLDRDNSLDAGEFFCAILLLYHKLNRIPYSGKKVPPKRKDVYALFYKYVTAQSEAETRMGIEKSGSCADTLGLPDTLVNTLSEHPKLQAKITPIITETYRKQQMFNRMLKLLKKKMTKPSPYIAATLFYIIFECVTVIISLVMNVDIERELIKYMIRLFSVFISTVVLLIIYHSVEIYKQETNNKRRIQRKRLFTDIDTEVYDYKKNSVHKTRAIDSTRIRTSTLIKEDFIIDSVGDSFMRRETFVFLCQEHFANLVFSEMWRIFWRALIIPLVAWQFKKLLDYFYKFLLLFINSVVLISTPITYKPLPFSLAMTLTMAIFAFIVEPVSSSIMWAKLHDTIKRDMETSSYDTETVVKRKRTGFFQKKVKGFFKAKEKEDMKTISTLMERMGQKTDNNRSTRTRKKRKSEVKQRIEKVVGLRKRTRQLNPTETASLTKILIEQKLNEEI